jgi:hypothetical protein
MGWRPVPKLRLTTWRKVCIRQQIGSDGLPRSVALFVWQDREHMIAAKGFVICRDVSKL